MGGVTIKNLCIGGIGTSGVWTTNQDLTLAAMQLEFGKSMSCLISKKQMEH